MLPSVKLGPIDRTDTPVCPNCGGPGKHWYEEINLCDRCTDLFLSLIRSSCEKGEAIELDRTDACLIFSDLVEEGPDS